MRPIGFSTGALALGDFRSALAMLTDVATTAVELSALRDHELRPLMNALGSLDLHKFGYVSIHVPSKLKSLSEAAVAESLLPCIGLKIPIVIHPDVIDEPSCWEPFGALLCIENMDKRKRTGRMIEELVPFFSMFPKATFCLDIAHARQMDSTMTETIGMLRRFGDRLRQVHISEIDTEGHHSRLSLTTILAGRSVAALIKDDIPIIIESMIPQKDMQREIDAARRTLSEPARSAWECQDWGDLA